MIDEDFRPDDEVEINERGDPNDGKRGVVLRVGRWGKASKYTVLVGRSRDAVPADQWPDFATARWYKPENLTRVEQS